MLIQRCNFHSFRVKSKRRFVQPNNGFMLQLRLFHKMGWKIDSNHEKFKLYRLRMAADNVRKGMLLQCHSHSSGEEPNEPRIIHFL